MEKTTDEVLPDHWPMGPSSAARWVECPGSLRVEHPEDTSDKSAADRGTLGHHMVEARLEALNQDCLNFSYNEWLSDDDLAFLNTFDAESQEILRNAVNVCFDHVCNLIAGGYEVHSELKIPDNFIEEHGGTTDIVAMKGYEMRVVDFKMGQRGVSIERNRQVMDYLILARQEFPGFKTFFGTIIQPAVGGVMTLEFSKEDLDAHERDVIRASISDEFKAGDHCEFCPLMHACTTHGQHVADTCKEFPDLTQLSTDIITQPTDEQAEILAKMYVTGKIAKAICDGASTLIKTHYNRGYDFTPFGVDVQKTTYMSWSDDPELCAETIAKENDIDPALYTVPAGIVSPAVIRGATKLTLKEFRKQYARMLNLSERQKMVTGKVGIQDFPEFSDLTNVTS